MKTLVGTPDPEPTPQQGYSPVWSTSNTCGWIHWHPQAPASTTVTVTW